MNFKSLFSLTAFLAILATQTTKAQVDVTAQPLGLLFGTFNFGADFAISESFSHLGEAAALTLHRAQVPVHPPLCTFM